MLLNGSNALVGPCDQPACGAIAIGEDAFCYGCSHTYCRDHYDCAEHECRYERLNSYKEKKDWEATLEDLDRVAIRERASQLRPGHESTVDIPDEFDSLDHSLAGSQHFHLTTRFDDGVEWLIRLSFLPLGPQAPEIVEASLNSEVATYRALHAAGLPVAVVHDWGIADFSLSRNPHSSYIIYDKMPGQPCDFVSAADYSEDESETGSDVASVTSVTSSKHSGLSEELCSEESRGLSVCADDDAEEVEPAGCEDDREACTTGSSPSPSRVTGTNDGTDHRIQVCIGSYVAVAIKLSARPFEAIGSLTYDESGQIVLGSPVSYFTCDVKGGIGKEGPFRTVRAFYLSEIDQFLDSLVAGVRHREGLLLPFLAHVEWRRHIEAHEELGREETDFYIEQPDSHDGNFLFFDGQITAIVDWDSAVTTTKAVAFASPDWARGCEPSLELTEREVMLCEAYEQAGRADLADCVRAGPFHPVCRELFYVDDYSDPNDILATMNRITTMLAPAEPRCSSLGEWALSALERHKHDPRLQQILDLDEHLELTRRRGQPINPDEEKDDPWYEKEIRWTPRMLCDIL